MKVRKILFLCLLLVGSILHAQQEVPYDEVFELEDYNFILGTHGIGGKYQFNEESLLVEQVKHIRSMGSNILKISLGKNSPNSYELGKIKAKSNLKLFLGSPEYKKVFDMDFKYVFAWVHTLTDVKWKQKFDKKDAEKIYDEMYEFASFLLQTYDNSGKTFLIGNWEGDWLLHGGFDRTRTPKKAHIDNMAKWFNVRQKAIDDAKANVKHSNVELYHYIEANLVLKGMQGQPCIAKDVLPQVNVDFVSYSSYEAIKNKTYQEKKKTLEEIFTFIEDRMKPKKGLPFERRVFLGEYGYHANSNKPKTFDKQFRETVEIMRIALETNIPFALHWQMYNNEYEKNGNSKQMSLINEQGEKRPLYYLHQNYYKKMNSYLKEYKSVNHKYPTQSDFRIEALKTLKSMKDSN